jgi:hypothetical protein
MPPTVQARKYTRGPQIFFTNDLTKEINLAGCATATQVSSFVRRPDSIELRTSSPAFGSESGISGKPKSMVEDIAAA